MGRTEGYISLTLKFYREQGRWVGECQELGTSTYGRSLPETKKQLVELVGLHINTLEDVGERQRFFKENGIKFHLNKPQMGVINLPYETKLDVFISQYLQKIPANSTC
jgi:hypothetical protein